jgi:3-oxoacyl-[acyl-carrier protein] reductase
MIADDVKGKKVIITGASKGIGYALAEAFAANGAELHLNARDETALLRAAKQLEEQYSVSVFVHPFDVSDEPAVKKFFQSYHKTHRQLDVLINNAGQMKSSLLMMTKPAALQHTFAVNVYGAMYCAQYASRLMARQKTGAIVNLSSVLAEKGSAGQSVYSASKAAINGFTKSLARELAPANIRVNAIAPGMIDTDLLSDLNEQKRAEALKSIRMGRLGLPSEVAALALFLASEKASYITGQVLAIDGGLDGGLLS